MASNKAWGAQLTMHVSLSDTEARKGLTVLRRQVVNSQKATRDLVKSFEEAGNQSGALDAKVNGLKDTIGKYKDYIRNLNSVYEASKRNKDVDKLQLADLEQRYQKATHAVDRYQNSLKRVTVLQNANQGKIKEATKIDIENSRIRKANIERLEKEGKGYGALQAKLDHYKQSVKGLNNELRLHRNAVTNLKNAGVADSSIYRDELKRVNQLKASIAQYKSMQQKLRDNTPVEYVKLNRKRDGVDDNYKRINSSWDVQKARLDAIQSMGDGGGYQIAKNEANLARIKDLKAQIEREQGSLTKTVQGTKLGDTINKRIQDMRKEVGELDNETRRYSEGLTDLNWKNQKYITIVNSQAKVLKNMGYKMQAQLEQAKALDNESKVLQRQREKEKVELDALKDKYGAQSRQYIDQARKVSGLAVQISGLNRRVKDLNTSTGGSYNAMNRLSDHITSHQRGANALAHGLSGVGRATFGVGIAAGAAIGKGTELNFQLDKINQTTKALLQNANKESNSDINANMKKAQQENVKLSQQYGISQSKIAQAQQDLAHRGYESNQMLQASKPLLQGAIASGYDLNDVLGVSTSAMEAFGMRSKNSGTMLRNTKKAINTMAYASDMSSSSFAGMGTAMSYVGATSKTAGQSMDQTASAIGQLALNGQESQKAGTGLRKVINSLITPTRSGKEQLQKLGVQVSDAHGKMKPLSDIMQQLHNGMANMSNSQKEDIFHNLFGTTGQASAAILVNNSQALGKFNDEVSRANKDKYVQKLSQQKMQTPINQIHRLEQAWHNFSMQLAGSFAPGITKGIEKVTDAIDAINNSGPTTKRLFKAFAIGLPIVGILSSGLAGLIRNIDTIRRGINGVTGLFSSNSKSQESNIATVNSQLSEENGLLEQNIQLLKEQSELNGVSGTTSKTANAENTANTASNSLSTVEKDANETKNVSRWGRFKSRFGGVKSTGTRLGKIGSEEALAKDTANVGKMSKLGGGALSKLPYLGYALMALQTALAFKGPTKSLGKRLGNVAGGGIGMLGGGELGATAGTAIAPGIGTLIGGALGATAGGVAGSPIGKYIGGGVQKGASYLWNAIGPNVNKQRAKKYNHTDSRSLDIGKELEDYSADSNVEDTLGDKKGDKAVSAIDKKEDSDKEDILNNIRKKLYDDNNKVDKQSSSDIKNVDSLLSDYDKSHKLSPGTNKAEAKKGYSSATDSEKGYYDEQYKQAQQAIDDLDKLHTSDSEKRVKQLQKTNQAIENAEATSSATQVEIKRKLSASKGHMSDKEAGKLIADAHKVEKQQIASAKKSFKQQKGAAWDTYNAKVDSAYRAWKAGTITKKQYEDAVSQAQTNRDKTIQASEDTKNKKIENARKAKKKVVKSAQDETTDHLASVDTETGQTLNKFQSWYNSVSQIFSGVASWFDKKADGVGKWWNSTSVGKFAKKHSGATNLLKQGYNYVTNPIAPVKNLLGFANGSNGIKGNQSALVNEKGQEAVYNPKDNTFRLINGGPQVTKLHDGDHVLNAVDTRKLLHGGLGNGKTLKGYAKGTNNAVPAKGAKYSGNQGALTPDSLKDLTAQSSKAFKSVYEDSKNWVDKTHDYITKQFDDIDTKSGKNFKNIHDSALNAIKDFEKQYQSISGNIVLLTRGSMGQSIDQLNRGFSGINGTLNQFGSKKDILTPIHYATGSNGRVTKEHNAIVNDALNGYEQEAIVNSNGVFLPKQRNAQVNLKRGDAVLNGNQTKAFLGSLGLAHYAKGTGVDNNQLEELIINGLSHTSNQLRDNFGSKILPSGSDLQRLVTENAKGGLNSAILPWYKSIFEVLQNATGSGNASNEHANGDKNELGVNSPLYQLAKKQLGSDRLKWVSKYLGDYGKGFTIPTKEHANLLREAGIPENEWPDYNYIISNESGWRPTATNPNGGAYGLPQALPASKMASAGADWRTNPVTQLKWQHQYINNRYGSSANARRFWQVHHNYENGGLITQDQIARVGEHNRPEMILPLTDKMKTVRLAKQAVDFVNANDKSNANGSQAQQNRIYDDKIDKLTKDVDKMVKLVSVLAQNSGSPVKAYITDRELAKHTNKAKQKEAIQNALRRGQPLV